MGRKSRKKNEHREANRPSDLSAHKRLGKTLVPPLASIPNLRTRSWINDGLPEYIWASLLLVAGPREAVLEVFRELGQRVHALGENAVTDVSLSGIAHDLPQSKETVVDFICQSPLAKAVLAPMLLFPSLPARQVWEEAIHLDPPGDAWDRIAKSVLETLDHQSQMATDIRWLSVLPMVAAGRIRFPTEYANTIREIELYPHLGDQRSVRPTIRSMELAVSGSMASDYPRTWSGEFWIHCKRSTGCAPLGSYYPVAATSKGTTRKIVDDVHKTLLEHCLATSTTTAVDPKHDTTFGTALYAIQLVREAMAIGASTSLSGRFVLRGVLELFVTIAYLTKRNDDELWKSYRVYGSGQAKLSSLKIDASSEKPNGVSVQTLEALANEDIWQEFLTIDLGHWDNSNTRKMSEDAGVKDYYDRYYPWTSMYIHGHWGALRTTVFDTCANPLHRLHRIPRETVQAQPDILPDVVRLTDRILSLLGRLYPPFSKRLSSAE